jgi:23S rRNA (guanine745-N1)-methyltransferase
VRADITPFLRCPVCGRPLTPATAALRCPAGHSFDVARQGYVNLLAGKAPPGGDTPAMVAARAELLATGHLDGIVAAVATEAARCRQEYDRGFVLDVGAGTGHHLARVLDALPGHLGLALDAAKPAAKRAAGAHDRAGAAVVDAWRGLPVADGVADLILNIFAPRNGAEFARVLAPGGALLVVTPTPGHLAELVTALGLIGVDPAKDRRLDVALGRWFRLTGSLLYEHELALSAKEAGLLVAMGPNAWHVAPAAVATLADPVRVTVSVRLSVYRAA